MRPLHDVHQVCPSTPRTHHEHGLCTQVLIRDGRRLQTRPVKLSVDEQNVVINTSGGQHEKQYTLRLGDIVGCRVHANGMCWPLACIHCIFTTDGHSPPPS